jgi:MFS family permease
MGVHVTDVDPDRLDPRRWKALALLCTAGFMVILDSQIVLLALPSIQIDLGLAVGGAQWVLSAYLLSFGGLLLLGGRAGDLLGRRRVFMAGTALFLVTSLACGLAWAGGILIAARVLQGASAAIMTPTALSILTTTFPEGSERNKALAIWSAMGGFGATAALLIGGSLTTLLGWEWIFFLNVPVAIGLLGLSPVLLRESLGGHAHGRVYDPGGAVTITAALAIGLYAIVTAPQVGWTSVQGIGLFAAAVILLGFFAVIENRSVSPLVPPGIFRSRTFSGGNLLTLLAGMTAFGMSWAVSQYAQQVLGYSPLTFGIGAAVMPVMAAVGAYVGQAVVTRTGPRPVGVAGMVLMGVGCLLLSQVSAGGSYLGDLFLGLVLFGLGLGAGPTAGAIAVFTGVGEEESGLASGVNTAAFQIGGALGVAICSTAAVPHTADVLRASAGRAEALVALTEGFRFGFMAAAGFAVLGLLVAATLPPTRWPPGPRQPAPPHGSRRVPAPAPRPPSAADAAARPDAERSPGTSPPASLGFPP